MNQYLSVFGLFARSTLYKLIGVVIIVAAVQTGMFLYTLHHTEGIVLLENLISQSKIVYVFGVGFLLYYAVLCGISKHISKVVLTMHRLSIKERTANWIGVLYNATALIAFLAAELAVCLILCGFYWNSDASGDYQQVIYTAFYRCDLLHSLLPMEDYLVLFVNALYVLSLSILAAYMQQQNRRGKQVFLTAFAAGITCAEFVQNGNSSGGVLGALLVSMLAVFPAGAISKSGALDEDNFYGGEDERYETEI